MTIKTLLLGLAASAAFAGNAQAATNLVVNGGFETWGLGANSDEFSTQYGPGNGQLQGWTTDGLAFVFVPGDIDAVGRYGGFSLYRPENGTNNGLTVSGQGGNFIASDADRGFGAPITQLISGLTVGREYNVSFEWAAAQQTNFFGDTFESWQVSLLDSGNNVTADYSTGFVNNPEAGFQPWRAASFRFTATEAAQTLRFWADGGPGGLPPFSLLDNVSVTDVPEPSSWVMLIAGFGLVGAAARRRRPATIAA
ncbi:hypothetical protein IP88_09965 [alpha proteobacterium AAP81b]|nr:hypothetical protein IP88_09965 [alpha proteobacterium AAP81b]